MAHRISLVQQVGSHHFPRFVITDDRCNFWSGILWTPEKTEARLYAGLDDISVDCAELQREETVGKKHRRLAAVTITIEAFSDLPLDAKELELWLQKQLRLIANYESGSGPTPDSIVMAAVNWPDYREIEGRKGQS